MIAEPVNKDTVAEPFDTDNNNDTRNGTNTAGRGVCVIKLPRYVPTPDAFNTAPKAPAAPVANIINPDLSTASLNHS